MHYKIRVVGAGPPENIQASSAQEAANIFVNHRQLPDTGWILIEDDRCGFTQIEIQNRKLAESSFSTSATKTKPAPTAEQIRAQRRSAITQVIAGIVLFGIGLLFTIDSIRSASENLSSHQITIAGGTMAWGVGYISIGVIRLFTNDADS